jgi:zinc protease
MKNIFLKLFLVLFVFVQYGYAQVDRSKAPEPGPAPEIQLGKPATFVLKNGLRVFVVQNKKLPRVAYSLVLDNDPIVEGEKAGYVSLTGQLLRRGTHARTKDQLDEEIDFIGAKISTSSSGAYAAALSSHSDKLMELMADMVLNPSFPGEELEKIRKQKVSSIVSNKNNPNHIAANVAKVLSYGTDHPYGELVTEKTVANVILEDCKDYYHAYFKPNNAYLAIVGDITPRQAKKLVRKHFRKWKKGAVPEKTYQMPEPPQKTSFAIVERPEAVQSVLEVTYPVDLHPANPDVIKARVMNQILGGGFTSRLFMNLREKHGYTYGAYSSLSTDKLTGRFSVSTSVRNEVTDSAVVQIMHELKRMVNEDVTEDEIQEIKNFLTGSFARSLENPETVANFAINIARYGLPKDYYNNYLKSIESVTIKDVREMAEKYVRPENAHVVVVTNGKEVVPKLEPIGNINYYSIYGEKKDPAKAQVPAGVDANVVIDKYLKALGGKDNLKKIQDVKINMAAEIQGYQLSIQNVMKQPNFSYNEISVGNMEIEKTVFDGQEVRVYERGMQREISQDQANDIKLQSSMFPELRYKELGVQTKLTGIEKIEGKEAYALKVTYPSGTATTQYFDKETNLKVRVVTNVETPNGPMTQTVDYDNYKAVEGVLFPHRLTLQPQQISAEASSIQVNQGLSEEFFKKQ